MEQTQFKLMTKFFFKFKKSYFWCVSQIFGANTETQRNLTIQFQEDTWTDDRIEREADPIS